MPEPTNDSDSAIVSRVLRGDREDYALLVDRYSSLVLRFLAGRGLRAMELDEAAQDVFVRVFQNLEKIHQPSQFSSYLMTAAHRRFLDSQKSRSLKNVNRDLDTFADHRSHDSGETIVEIQDAIARLPESMQIAIGLKYSHQHSAAEIAHIVGQSVGTVTKTLSRAYERLRSNERLREYWEGEQ